MYAKFSIVVGFTSLTDVAVPNIAVDIIPNNGPVVVTTGEFKCFFAYRVSVGYSGESAVVLFENPEFKRVVIKYIYTTSVEQSAFNPGAFGELYVL